ncbi:MAG: ribonuclease H-like domain-containing protein [Thermoguttaceae bacterium]
MTTPRRYLAFDIETAKITDDPSDWKSQRPLGISCAATLFSNANEPTLWFGGNEADRMNREEAARLVEYLSKQVGNGYTLLTWNGLGFDLDILAEESGLFENCRELASNHVDLMFHVLCRLGYGVSLDAAAKGMNLAGKPEGMNGAKAPVMWAEGKREEVLKYVAQDVRTTLDLATVCESGGALRWVARSGKVRTMRLPGGWLTVSDALELPLPDTSWMDEPWSRGTFTGWMGLLERT